MIVLRRFLALVALFFWQGGFTFYASVVVPIGQQVFGPLRQGFLTRQVTVYLNLAGALALLMLVWDLLAARDPSKWRRRSRWLLWAGMMLTLLWLIRLHGHLDEMLVAKGYIIREADTFRSGHRLYLWISTVQWAWGLLYLLATLVVWRKEDRMDRDVVGMQMQKKFRRWLLRRRPVTEAVIRRNKDNDNVFVVGCKRSFKKNKIFFSSAPAEKTEKAEVSRLLLSMREQNARSISLLVREELRNSCGMVDFEEGGATEIRLFPS